MHSLRPWRVVPACEWERMAGLPLSGPQAAARCRCCAVPCRSFSGWLPPAAPPPQAASSRAVCVTPGHQVRLPADSVISSSCSRPTWASRSAGAARLAEQLPLLTHCRGAAASDCSQQPAARICPAATCRPLRRHRRRRCSRRTAPPSTWAQARTLTPREADHAPHGAAQLAHTPHEAEPLALAISTTQFSLVLFGFGPAPPP